MENHNGDSLNIDDMKLLSLGLFLVILIGCAPTPSTVLPIKTPSAMPTIAHMGVGVNTTIDNNNKIGEKLKDQQNTIRDQRQMISDTLAQADILKKKIEDNKAITKMEMDKLIDNFKKVEARNLFIESQNMSLITDKNNQASVLAGLQEDLSTTRQQVSNKEQEAENLRNGADTIARENSKLKKDLASAEVEAAKSGVYKHWIWGLIGAFVLYTIIKNVLMVYFPLTKFRI